MSIRSALPGKALKVSTAKCVRRLGLICLPARRDIDRELKRKHIIIPREGNTGVLRVLYGISEYCFELTVVRVT